MTLLVTGRQQTQVMNVVYQGQRWFVVGDDWDGLLLEKMESMDEPATRVYAPYGSNDLIVDPTDAEVEEAEKGTPGSDQEI